MNKINQEATYQEFSQKNIVNVIPISEYNSLDEIWCRKERADDELYKYETFFINEDNQTVAHFVLEESFIVEHLNQDCENFEDIEFGIEDGCFTVKKDNPQPYRCNLLNLIDCCEVECHNEQPCNAC